MDLKQLQSLVNSGDVWSLEGAMGREAMRLIQSGQLMLGRTACFDFWGNRIPGRYEVKRGTPGSRAYVRQMMGEYHARKMQAVR